MWNMTLRVCLNRSAFLLFSLSREISPFFLHEHVLSLLVSKLFILSLHSLYKFHVSFFVFSHFNSLPPASLSLLLLLFNCDFHGYLTSRAYELMSRVAYRTLISNWIDRCFGQHLWNSVHSLSRENPRIPTNPLSGNQQPPLLWGEWIRSQILLEINAGIAAMLDSNWSYFPAPPRVHEGFFFWRYNSVPLIRRLSATAYTTCLFVTHIYGLFWAHIYARL